MTQLLLRHRDAWKRCGGLDTAEEIAQQPAVWRALVHVLETQRGAIDRFLGDALRKPDQRVILTGAGTSAYIGEVVADELNAAWPAQVRAVASTSLLTHPDHYLERDKPTLLVSFARSGCSPESLAAVDLVARSVEAPRFLNITCNPDGDLAKRGAGRADTFNLLMPEGCCDRGFAMTSSFSTMLLAALAALGKESWATRLMRIHRLAMAAENALHDWAPRIAELAANALSRVVYLGSGPLEALAKESALKVLELTCGAALAMANTPLGFRHGPKSAVNADTLVVMFRSQSAVARAYERDLLAELRRDGVAGDVLTVGPAGSTGEGIDFPLALQELADTSDSWLAAVWVVMAQQYALQRSHALGLRPDSPFSDGTLNRVVQGVTIY
ncbi:SIS domain-containing protein [Tahibacter amnicola]|uniref:SIS domain-containing protein n=1 Tax=Tahibacter amnicola TaxID=2976241 RepID=A0ABY6BS26_9GAMM|nr:SIS domain-containing protein [Tahibacter amnicola]UXI70572.1 SIS domain-containing protein [Tahibacter amnicola]